MLTDFQCSHGLNLCLPCVYTDNESDSLSLLNKAKEELTSNLEYELIFGCEQHLSLSGGVVLCHN